MPVLPYFCIFQDGGELWVWVMKLWLQQPVHVGLHYRTVPLQEVVRAQCILPTAKQKTE